MKRALAFLFVALFGAGTGAAAEPIRHRVQPGDTVPRLSWQYKIRAELIRRANGLSGDTLSPGTMIVIPAPGDAAPAISVAVPLPRPTPPTAFPPPERPRPPTSEERPPRRAEASPRLPTSDRKVSSYTTVLSAEPPAAPSTPPRTPPPAANRAPAPLDEPPLGQEEVPRTAVKPDPRPALPDPPPPVNRPATAEPRPPQALIAAARLLSTQGIPYNGRWQPPGEGGEWVMDCSNTTRWLFREAGVTLPRTASEQYLTLERARKLWKAPRGWFSSEVNAKKLDRDLRTGDLLFWENTYKPVRRPDITHVMVFLGVDEQGHWMMAGSERAKGVNIYRFDPGKKKGGYRSFFGLFHHEGKFVAYGRPFARG